LLTILKEYIKEKYNKPGNVYLGLVHRLDRPVGGVMVFARTSKAASRLSEQVRNKEIKKEYLAIVHGKVENGVLTDYLLKDTKTNISKVVDKKTKNAKEAILEYELVNYDALNDTSLVKINLITGRSHQIRVQFSHINHPLVCDKKYGLSYDKKEPVKLWAYKLTFKHPVKDEIMNFTNYPDWGKIN